MQSFILSILDDIELGNKNHDSRGRFASSKGSRTSAATSSEPPRLSKSERVLIERASEENANSNFTAVEKRKLSKIIDKQPPLKRDMVVYRGIDDIAEGRFSGMKWKETDKFTSTSTSRDVAARYARNRGGVVVRIKIPKGARVLRYSDHGYWGNDEVLINRGAKFKAVKDKAWDIKLGMDVDIEIEMFVDLANKYHDSRGRFASKSGGGGGGIRPINRDKMATALGNLDPMESDVLDMEPNARADYLVQNYQTFADSLGLKTRVVRMSDDEFNAKVSKIADELGVEPDEIAGLHASRRGESHSQIFMPNRTLMVNDEDPEVSLGDSMSTAFHEIGHAYELSMGVRSGNTTKSGRDAYSKNKHEVFADDFSITIIEAFQDSDGDVDDVIDSLEMFLEDEYLEA